LSGEFASRTTQVSSVPGELPPATDDLEALRRTLSPALATQLAALGGRASPEQMDAAVLKLCAWRPLTREQLAGLTRRNARHLHNSALKRLIGSGRLEYLYPDQRHHPQQAYRTREAAAETAGDEPASS
jgi:hypothetical protein